MKMTKKKWIVVVLLIILISGACGVFILSRPTNKEVDVVSKAYLMNGFEEYDDLVKTNNHFGLWGDISINADEEYITQGVGSAKFELDYNSEYGNPDQSGKVIKTGALRFLTENYDNSFMFLDKIRTVSFDLYNADDREYTIYFAAYADGNNCLYSDGTVLSANSWNYVTFNINPHMFEENTAVKEYILYINGMDELTEKRATFYMDNMRAEVLDDTSSVSSPQFKDDETGNEILRFDNGEDINYILTKVNAASDQYLPFIYADYDKSFTQVGENGGLCVSLNHARSRADLWDSQVTGYEIEIAKDILARIESPKEISLDIFNPSSVIHKVSLVLGSGEDEYVASVSVPAGEEATVCLDDLDISSVDTLLIRMDCRTLSDMSCLYFTNLIYSE